MIIYDTSYPVVVDADTGNDTTGARRGKPFATLAAALTAAQVGDMIVVRPGAYTASASLSKAGVSWHFCDGAVVTTSGSIYAFNAVAGDVLVTGDGEFQLGASGNFANPSNAAFNFRCYCKKIQSSGVSLIVPSSTVPRYFELNCQSVIHTSTSVNPAIIGLAAGAGWGGVFNLRLKRVVVGSYGMVINGGATINLCTDTFLFTNASAGRIFSLNNGGSGGYFNLAPCTAGAKCNFMGMKTGDIYQYSAAGSTGITITDANIRQRSDKTVLSLYTAQANTPITWGGTCRMVDDVGGTGSWSQTGSYTLDTSMFLKAYTFSGTTCTCSSHGYSTGAQVYLISTTTIPTGVAEMTVYYLRNLSSSTFSLHPTADDATNNTNAISLSGGSGTHYVMGV